MSAQLTLRGARPSDLPAVEALLQQASLPLDGVRESFEHFVVADDHGVLAGVAGLEMFGHDGVLRSVAVAPFRQGEGLGAHLTASVIERAKDAGLQRLYLLTTTAEGYFPRHGFRVIARDEASADARQSVEFRDACPASAVTMVLELER